MPRLHDDFRHKRNGCDADGGEVADDDGVDEAGAGHEDVGVGDDGEGDEMWMSDVTGETTLTTVI